MIQNKELLGLWISEEEGERLLVKDDEGMVVSIPSGEV